MDYSLFGGSKKPQYFLNPVQQQQEEPTVSLGVDTKSLTKGIDTSMPDLTPEPAVKAEPSKTAGEMGAAGVMAASSLLSKLMEGKALRERMMRERKAEAAKTSAKATMDTLSMQQKGTMDPLSQLIAAYR